MAEEAPKPKLHPLPGFCWMWPVGSLLPALIGALLVTLCLNPPADMLETIPRGHRRWGYLWVLGFCGIALSIAYWWFWYRFAVKRELSGRVWHLGTGLILGGAAYLFVTAWYVSGCIYLLTLAVWTQGNTKQYFTRT
jgi:hypothetical protein